MHKTLKEEVQEKEKLHEDPTPVVIKMTKKRYVLWGYLVYMYTVVTCVQFSAKKSMGDIRRKTKKNSDCTGRKHFRGKIAWF